MTVGAVGSRATAFGRGPFGLFVVESLRCGRVSDTSSSMDDLAGGESLASLVAVRADRAAEPTA
ncbi:hypothetical protein ACPCJT_16600 [Streptomyces griseoincarnatus]